jgi:LPS-assembly lipoprotein
MQRGSISAVLLLLSGCGFRPVYAPGADGAIGSAEAGLAQINVPPLPERSGQILRQFLQQNFDHGGGNGAKLYELVVSYGVAGEGIAIERGDSVATRIRLVGNASWSLVSADAQRKTLTSGHARAYDGFNPLDSQYFYSDLQGEQTQQRVAQAVADQISMQLAGYFRQHPPGS